MGALDPHVHKRNQQSLSGSHGEVPRSTGDSGQPIPSIDVSIVRQVYPH